MQKKSLFKDLYAFIPLLFSGLLCIALIFLLWQKSETEPQFSETLVELATVFISISGVVAIVILAYLIVHIIGLRNNRNSAIGTLGLVTQKMHYFREIIDFLYRSKMWLPNLKEYIDDEFEGLNFFEVKEFYKGKSKIAIEFLQENHDFQDTENLYLEMKSLLMTSPKEKRIPETITYPKMYNKEIVSKWLEHKCSSGLWYYFGYKYATFKEALNLEAVYERHQDKIMTLANSIDATAFEDSSFNEIFLSKLGEYMSKEVMPKLYEFQNQTGEGLPSSIKFLYAIFMVLILFGVLLPIMALLFALPSILLIIGYSLTIAIIFLMATSVYPFLSREAKN